MAVLHPDSGPANNDILFHPQLSGPLTPYLNHALCPHTHDQTPMQDPPDMVTMSNIIYLFLHFIFTFLFLNQQHFTRNTWCQKIAAVCSSLIHGRFICMYNIFLLQLFFMRKNNLHATKRNICILIGNHFGTLNLCWSSRNI